MQWQSCSGNRAMPIGAMAFAPWQSCLGKLAVAIAPWQSRHGNRAMAIVAWQSCRNNRAMVIVPWESCNGSRGSSIAPWPSCHGTRAMSAVPRQSCHGNRATAIVRWPWLLQLAASAAVVAPTPPGFLARGPCTRFSASGVLRPSQLLEPSIPRDLHGADGRWHRAPPSLTSPPTRLQAACRRCRHWRPGRRR